MFDLRKRLYFVLPAALMALLQHTIHESTHYLAARLLGEPVAEFHFLTGAMLTSRVIYATPVAERVGVQWLVIAWAPALLTTLIGYTLYASRHRWLTGIPLLNAGFWFATVYFLVVDPLYFGSRRLAALAGARVRRACAVGQPAPGIQAPPRVQGATGTVPVDTLAGRTGK